MPGIVAASTAVSVASLLVALAGVTFGIFQWRRQRGRVRIQVDESQATIYLRVVVDAPVPVHVNGMAYQVKARGRLLRLLRWLRDDDLRFRERFAALWRFRGMDVAMARLEQTAEWDELQSGAGDIPVAWSPIAGPPFPTTIPGYDDASWKLYGANYAPTFRDVLEQWGAKNPKVRFRAGISGHPHRVVHSPWIQVRHLRILRSENQHWSDNERGLPQPAFPDRELLNEMRREMRDDPAAT